MTAPLYVYIEEYLEMKKITMYHKKYEKDFINLNTAWVEDDKVLAACMAMPEILGHLCRKPFSRRL